jgi:hypothetical protein
MADRHHAGRDSRHIQSAIPLTEPSDKERGCRDWTVRNAATAPCLHGQRRLSPLRRNTVSVQRIYSCDALTHTASCLFARAKPLQADDSNAQCTITGLIGC